MREVQNQYHGFKIVSRFDDSPIEEDVPNQTAHVLMEIQGSGAKTWAKLCQEKGRTAAMSKIMDMDCWKEVSTHPTLSDAICTARELAQARKEAELNSEPPAKEE